MKPYFQFSDASSIVDDYFLVQKPGSPSELKRKSSRDFPEEAFSKFTDWERYKAAENFYHLNTHTQMILHELLQMWRDTCLQLQELFYEIKDPSQLNPAVEATSKRAYITTVGWVVQLFMEDKTLPSPDIVPSGDGGIDIEWTFEDRFISVQIHKSNPLNDRIYFRLKGAKFQSMKLNKVNLLNLLRH